MGHFCVRTLLLKWKKITTFALDIIRYMIDTSAFQGKTAAYYTLGCKLNFSETSTFGKMLEEFGVSRVKKGERADICLINTCSVTEQVFMMQMSAFSPFFARLTPYSSSILPKVDVSEKFSLQPNV